MTEELVCGTCEDAVIYGDTGTLWAEYPDAEEFAAELERRQLNAAESLSVQECVGVVAGYGDCAYCKEVVVDPKRYAP